LPELELLAMPPLPLAPPALSPPAEDPLLDPPDPAAAELEPATPALELVWAPALEALSVPPWPVSEELSSLQATARPRGNETRTTIW
jgi:hypothetical protein